MLTTLEIPLPAPHQSVQRVARRVRVRTTLLVPQAPLRRPIAKIKRLLLNHAAQIRRRPFMQSTNPPPHLLFRFGIINLPNLAPEIEKVFQLLTPFANPKPGVKETQYRYDRRKQLLPRPRVAVDPGVVFVGKQVFGNLDGFDGRCDDVFSSESRLDSAPIIFVFFEDVNESFVRHAMGN